MSEPYRLTLLNPVRLSKIPNKASIQTAAQEVLQSSDTWKAGKTFHKTVKTFHRPKGAGDGGSWFLRLTELKPEDIDFDTLWRALSVNKSETEAKFIPEIQTATKIKDVSPTQQVWSMLYKFTPPIANRVFTVLQDVSLDEVSGRRSGVIVSIPADLSTDPKLSKLEESGVRGMYVSVEQVLELENGNVQWKMATSSNPGGSIPGWLAESSMASSIAKDVPQLLAWLKANKESEDSKN